VLVRSPSFRRIIFLLLIAWLIILPAPMRAACVLSAPESGPQPSSEPCDSVLLSYSGVTVNMITFDMALVTLIITLPGILGALWRSLSHPTVLMRDFSLILDPPPPRPSSV